MAGPAKQTKQAAKPATPTQAPARPAAPPKDVPETGDGRGDVAPSASPTTPSRLRERYRSDVVPALLQEFKYENVMQVPRLDKVVVNIGLGEATRDPKQLDNAMRDLAAITGQKPIVRKAKKSIASFRLRAGQSIGAKVTLRGERMFEFLDRLINAALPRLRDFQGVPAKSFDGRGNYTLGLREQLVFPEIEYDKVDKVRGLEVTVVTTAPTDLEARRLLELLGMPFQKG